MANKIPLNLQAAAELELRRRHRERAASCYACELDILTAEIYAVPVPDPMICSHTLEQQDINSGFNQDVMQKTRDIYGVSETDVFAEQIF